MGNGFRNGDLIRFPNPKAWGKRLDYRIARGGEPEMNLFGLKVA